MGKRTNAVQEIIDNQEQKNQAQKQKLEDIESNLKRIELHIERLEEEKAKYAIEGQDNGELRQEYDKKIDEARQEAEQVKMQKVQYLQEGVDYTKYDEVFMQLTQQGMQIDKEINEIQAKMAMNRVKEQNFVYEYDENHNPTNGAEYKKINDKYNALLEKLYDLQEARRLCDQYLKKYHAELDEAAKKQFESIRDNTGNSEQGKKTTEDKADDKDKKSETNPDKDTGKDSDKDSKTDPNKDTDKDTDKDSKTDPNKDTNKDTDKDKKDAGKDEDEKSKDDALDEYNRMLEAYKEDLEKLYVLQAKYENNEIGYDEYKKFADYMVELYRIITKKYEEISKMNRETGDPVQAPNVEEKEEEPQPEPQPGPQPEPQLEPQPVENKVLRNKLNIRLSRDGLRLGSETIKYEDITSYDDKYETVENDIKNMLGQDKAKELIGKGDPLIILAMHKQLMSGEHISENEFKARLEEYHALITGKTSKDESNMSITYDLKGTSLFSRLTKRCEIAKENVDYLKVRAYESRDYADVKGGGLLFKIKSAIAKSKQKKLDKAEEEQTTYSNTGKEAGKEFSDKLKVDGKSQNRGKTKGNNTRTKGREKSTDEEEPDVNM